MGKCEYAKFNFWLGVAAYATALITSTTIIALLVSIKKDRV